jgi:hypothetical protein
MTVVFWTLYTMLFVLIAELGGYRQNLSAPSTAPITLIGTYPMTIVPPELEHPTGGSNDVTSI